MHLLTLFKPKRSVSLVLFLTLGGVVACSDPSKEISGTYETMISTTSDFVLDTLASSDTLPSTAESESQGRTLSLALYEDQRAELSTNFLDNEPPIVQKGSWSLLDNNRLRTYFVEKDGQFLLDTLTFYLDGSRLVLRGNPNAVADEVSLMRVPEP